MPPASSPTSSWSSATSAPTTPSAVIGGNERVVRPRLADAKFFFDQDRKKTLDSRVAALGKVVYHNKLGTQGERVERVRAHRAARSPSKLGGDDAGARRPTQAAQLAKADLRDRHGRRVPRAAGHHGPLLRAARRARAPTVADAIEDHYKPRFAGDALPRNQVGVVVALADKLETLAGMFGIGNLPTGDRDPFALRRHALGVIRMLIERDLPLRPATRCSRQPFAAVRAQAGDSDADRPSARRLHLRPPRRQPARAGLQRAGGRRRAGAAAAAPGRRAQAPGRRARLRRAARSAGAGRRQQAHRQHPEEVARGRSRTSSELLLQEPPRRRCTPRCRRSCPQADAQFDAGDYTASLQTLAALRAPVDAFFDGVMVNAEQTDLRLNRLGLLRRCTQAMNRVAQLERLAA